MSHCQLTIKPSYHVTKLLVLSEACKTGRCDDCTGLIDQGNGHTAVQCEHEHHLRTLPTSETAGKSLAL